MPDDTQPLRSIHWRELFPFTHIFRAFRIAIHPSKLVLGLLALLTLYAGGRILDGLWPRQASAIHHEAWLYERARLANSSALSEARLRERMAGVGSDAAEAAEAAFGRPGAGVQEPFAATVAAERERNIFRYQEILQELGVVNDTSQLRAAAERFDHHKEVQHRIVARRNDAIQAANKLLNDRIATAKGKERIAEAKREHAETVRELYARTFAELRYVQTIRPRGIFAEFFDYQVNQVNNVVSGVLSNNWLGGMGADPRGPGVVRSAVNFLTVGPVWLVRHHTLYFILFAALFLLVWAVFGGAISRIAAVHVARDEKISVRQALRFSIGKLLSFIFAPVIPLLIILVAGVALAVGGLLMYVPWIGPIVMAILFVLALIVGFVMTLVALGTVGGFNLMYPTVAVEGSDSFDAISRSFSYVFARPWRMLFYTAVAVAYGALTYLFVRFFIFVMLYLTHYFVGWWLSGQPATYWPQIWPPPSVESLPYDVNYSGLKWSEDVGAGILSFWIYLVIGMLGAFAISFYFSANTIIYFLMRREVDATELDEVYVEESEDDFGETAPVTRPADEMAAPPVGDMSAPGGGITDAAGSADPGGGSVRSYNAPSTDAPSGDMPDRSSGTSGSTPPTETPPA